MNTVYSKYGRRLLLFITTLLSTLHLSFSSDTINSTQIFRDDGSTTLVSSSGHFELVFFSPDNSDNRYLAIWYKRVSPRTVVWVANRDNPLRGVPTGALRVVQPGILALQNRTGGIAWSTNTSRQDIYIRLFSSEIDSERKRKIHIITLCVVFGILIILNLSILLYLYLKRKKKLNLQLEKTAGKPKLTSNANHLRVSHNEEFELPQFSLSTIKEATDNFSINNELDKGGFGPVYKGTLEDGKEIAVKRLSVTSHQGVDQFKNEVLCIAKLQHRNLVKLLGWCSEGDEMMLVYEYLTNKSLDKILFDPTRSTLLDWPRRLNIINGTARGLMYLHQNSCLHVIHRDLKASNILLDLDMNAKISDFGFARTFGGNETEANTSQVVGTYGYLSPEYAMEGNFSFKSDVYSFGVLVLEVVSAKRDRGFTHMDQRLNLLGHAWTLYKEDKSVEVVDSCVRNSLHLTEIMRTIHIGLLCVQEQPDDRPTMSSVVFMLSNDVVLAEAKCPGFFTAREVPRTATSGSSRPRSSINTMTITQLEPR